MRRILWPIAAAVLLAAAQPATAADEPAARTIMQQVEDREDGDNQTSDMEMTLVDKRGQKRVRKIATFAKDKGEDELRLMFFLQPADVKDTAFLTYDYDDPGRDDDQWLYLPALRKSKRIATSDKSGSFMGSDLNYSDMTSRDLEDYDFNFYPKQKEIEVNGHPCWLIESHPRSDEVIDETGYRKSLLFVRQDNYYVVRAVHWEETGDYMKFFDVRRLERIDGIWVGTEMHVARKQGKRTVHQTLLRLANVKFNQNLDEELFTIRRMEKGL